MNSLLIASLIFLITVVPQCGPFPSKLPHPVDEIPPYLERIDAFPSSEICGTFDVIGNITDDAQEDINPTGVSRIWLTLDGSEIEDWYPSYDCPFAVEFAIANIELFSTGKLELRAKDCEGNEAILKQVIVDQVSDEDPPVPTFVFPTDGATIFGSNWIFEVAVASDNEDLDVCLEIDGVAVGCDDTIPYKWPVSDLDPGIHIALAIAEDSCGYHGESEVTFFIEEE